MDGNNAHQRDGSLEDQLRNMILSAGASGNQPQPSVVLPTLPTNASAYRPFDASGPARGGFHRGGHHRGNFSGHHHRGNFGNHGPHHHHGPHHGHYRGSGPDSASSVPGSLNGHAHPQHHHHHHPRHDPNPAFGYTAGAPPFGRGRAGPPPYVSQNGQGPNARTQVDPNDFHREPHRVMQHRQHPRELYQPQSYHLPVQSGPAFDKQWQYLEDLLSKQVPPIEMTADEIASKDKFRLHLENICLNLKTKHPDFDLPTVALHSFGSLSSGFATAGSDMDLAIVTDSEISKEEQFSLHENNLPRVLEKELLDNGIGARLLTRTRVPIIKICETPPPELLTALREERLRWDSLPEDEKYALHDVQQPKKDVEVAITESKTTETVSVNISSSLPGQETSSVVMHVITAGDEKSKPQPTSQVDTPPVAIIGLSDEKIKLQDHNGSTTAPVKVIEIEQRDVTSQDTSAAQPNQAVQARQRRDKAWTRERVPGPLDFPKENVGIQCDINFFNPLGLFNTKLLRCYAKCDHRVIPMVLFVKAWAKQRKINSSYSGTLSSYGYVLMVLHFLVNVAQPPVLPNLQLQAVRTGTPGTVVDGCEVRFFGDEGEIENSASRGLITQNTEPLGMLLRGFFQYFASTAGGQGFIWMQDVLSLRSPGGLLKKEEKGWTGAKTEVGDHQKEVRHRYLFAIEDPFELTHNVARTVTHNGIVAIRDEFRRSWRIIQAVGRGLTPNDGELFADLHEGPEPVVEAASLKQLPPPQPPQPAQPKAESAVDTKPAQPQQYADAFPQLGAPKAPAKVQTSDPAILTAQKPPAQGKFPRSRQRSWKKQAAVSNGGVAAVAEMK